MSRTGETGWWGRNWAWAVPLFCVGLIAAAAGVLALLFPLVFGLLRSSGAYTEALAAVRADPRVIAALGEPIEEGWLVTGNVHISGGSGEADLSFTISGPNGAGTVYTEARRSAGEWAPTTLIVILGDSGQRIDVLAPADGVEQEGREQARPEDHGPAATRTNGRRNDEKANGVAVRVDDAGAVVRLRGGGSGSGVCQAGAAGADRGGGRLVGGDV